MLRCFPLKQICHIDTAILFMTQLTQPHTGKTWDNISISRRTEHRTTLGYYFHIKYSKLAQCISGPKNSLFTFLARIK